MSQKINPKSLRLGFSKIWKIFSQHYGISLKYFNILFYRYTISINFIMKKLIHNNHIINQIELWHNNSSLDIKIYMINPNYLSSSYKIIDTITYWFYFNNSIKIHFILHKMNFCSSILLKLYIEYLFKTLNYSPKKILATLSVLINNKFHLTKLTYSKLGPLNLYLKGYKIMLNGRFENSKSAMAKTLTLKKGSLKLTSLNNNIEFFNQNLDTKFGICNFKLWIFYKIN